jgi:hypothetical protein
MDNKDTIKIQYFGGTNPGLTRDVIPADWHPKAGYLIFTAFDPSDGYVKNFATRKTVVPEKEKEKEKETKKKKKKKKKQKSKKVSKHQHNELRCETLTNKKHKKTYTCLPNLPHLPPIAKLSRKTANHALIPPKKILSFVAPMKNASNWSVKTRKRNAVAPPFIPIGCAICITPKPSHHLLSRRRRSAIVS